MTVLYYGNKIKINILIKKIGTVFLILFSLFASLFLSSSILEYVKTGMRLCFSAVIGAVFPFIILTDIIYSFCDFESLSLPKSCFERLFKINGSAIGAFLCGILCGFPLGVRVAANLYRDNLISKDECERLIGFSNNAGPAFIISGIGIAMRGNFTDGIILYFSMLLSAISVGFLSSIGKEATKNHASRIKECFSLTSSVKSAGIGAVTVCSFVIFFSVICGIADLITENITIMSFILPFIEVSNSAKFLSESHQLNTRITLLLTSFAISFSGISVHLQAKSYLAGTDIKMKVYYISKLIQGIFSVAFSLLFSIILY